MWKPLARTELGDVSFKTHSTQTFNLSATGVPSSAKEVFIYITMMTGYNTCPDSDIEVAVWTSDGNTEYKKYLFGHLYHQTAWSYNSENMSFPLTPGHHTLNVQYTGPTSIEKYQCHVYVIGYQP